MRIVPTQVSNCESLALENRNQTHAFEASIAFLAAYVQKRRHEIDAVHGFASRRAGLRLAGPADDQRHAEAAFVEVAFAFAQRRVNRGWRVRTFEDTQPAIIAGE